MFETEKFVLVVIMKINIGLQHSSAKPTKNEISSSLTLLIHNIGNLYSAYLYMNLFILLCLPRKPHQSYRHSLEGTNGFLWSFVLEEIREPGENHWPWVSNHYPAHMMTPGIKPESGH